MIAPMDHELLRGRCLLQKRGADRSDMGHVTLEVFACFIQGGSHAYGKHGRLRSRTARLLLMSAEEHGRELNALAYHKGADADGAMKFVGAERQRVHVEFAKRDRNFSHRSRRIAKDEGSAAEFLRKRFDRLPRAGFVIDEHRGDEAQILGPFARKDEDAVSIDIQNQPTAATPFHFSDRFEHAGMFDRSGGKRSRRRRQAKNGKVVRLRCPACENDLLGLSIQASGDPFARIFKHLPRLAAKRMAAGGIAEPIAHRSPHRFFGDGRKLSGGGVVEVDAFHACIVASCRPLQSARFHPA